MGRGYSCRVNIQVLYSLLVLCITVISLMGNKSHYCIGLKNKNCSGFHTTDNSLRLGALCALLWRILTWCSRKRPTLKACHVPGWLNAVADKLSRLGQIRGISSSRGLPVDLHPVAPASGRPVHNEVQQ